MSVGITGTKLRSLVLKIEAFSTDRAEATLLMSQIKLLFYRQGQSDALLELQRSVVSALSVENASFLELRSVASAL